MIDCREQNGAFWKDWSLYLDYFRMLRHKFFHRAKKVPVSEEELAARKKKKKGEKDSDKKEKDSKKYVDDAESSHAEGKSDDKSDVKVLANH